MPSQLHEAIVRLFRNRPQLAPELLAEALEIELPAYTEARIESADVTDIEPAEYRADLVVLLYERAPVLAIVVEVQLSQDPDKVFTWPVYATGLRARLRCAAEVLVVCADEPTARWAARPIALGGDSLFQPRVIGPSGVPAITDLDRAKADPELAVLSAMAYGHDADPHKSVAIALAAATASAALDAERSSLYVDLVYAALGEAARKCLQAMDPAKYEYQSEFARRYFSEGKAAGRTDTLLKQLQLKFAPLTPDTIDRVRSASLEELDLWTERILSATSLDDVLG